MQSKTSFFNRTVFRKNLTRYAPIWVLYALCLCMGVLLDYSNSMDVPRQAKFFFVYSYGSQVGETLAVINLLYGLLVGQLLFGDLFNSRMCNALHALPLRRESWLATNLLSGLAFSVIPTGIASLMAVPLLSGSIYENAWLLPVLWFLAANLEFICCLGIAAFAAMCTGTRLTMAAGYGLIHFGAYIVYWLVDTVYTPLLYGVVTPSTLAHALTPVSHMMEYQFVDMGKSWWELERLGQDLETMRLSFTLTENWWRLLAWSGIGVLFASGSWVLYRNRDLERAGDAVAFSRLVPVFQVLCALFVMAASRYAVEFVLGIRQMGMLIMAFGLILGWFIAKMLVARAINVFSLKNWAGLGILACALAVTLVATHFDILNLDERRPELDDIASVRYDSGYTGSRELEDPAQIADILRLHALALDERLEDTGLYRIQDDGSRVPCIEDSGLQPTTAAVILDKDAVPEIPLGYEGYVNAINMSLRYEMKNGSNIRRRYIIWEDSQAGQLLRSYLSSWEHVAEGTVNANGVPTQVLDLVLQSFRGFAVSSVYLKPEIQNLTVEDARAFLKAVRADCEAGLMAQDERFHRGVFHKEVTDHYGQTYQDYNEYVWIELVGLEHSWNIRIFPDCVNTMQWLTDQDLLDCQVRHGAVVLPG